MSNPLRGVNPNLHRASLLALSLGLLVSAVPRDSEALQFENFDDTAASSDVTFLVLNTPAGTVDGDLLIAALTTHGNTSGSLAPPGGGGWNLLTVDAIGNNATLGVWWKLAASEPAAHAWTWSGGQQAYGYIMRFSGADLTTPIETFATGTGSSPSPAAPAITSNDPNSLIIRVGGFDGDDVTIGDAGMAGTTTITMNVSGTGTGTASSGATHAPRGGSPSVPAANFTLTAAEQWRTVTLALVQLCGNGVLEGSEACDDGAGNGTTTCGCALDCTLPTAGTACDNATVCDGAETCDGAGTCTAGTPLICDNGQFCDGVEPCDAGLGCQAGTPVDPDDGVACTDDSCDEVGDVVVNTPNDGNCANVDFCDGDETCDALLDCQAGTPVDPDDGVACTDDSCDEVGDVVVNTPNDGNCANVDFCDGDETCDALLDCQAGTPVDPDDGVACTDDSCDEVGDVVVNTPNDGNCANGDFCDGDETCDALLDCQAGTPPGDGVACTDDSCDEVLDVVTGIPNDANCDNGQFCDGDETCDALLDCLAGTPPPLTPDGVACTDAVCDEEGNRIEQVPNDSLCQNSTVCDGTEECHPIFDCEMDPFGPLDCDDGDTCTADACDAVTGCSNAPIPGCVPVPAASPGGRALLSLLVVGAGALLLSRRRGLKV